MKLQRVAVPRLPDTSIGRAHEKNMSVGQIAPLNGALSTNDVGVQARQPVWRHLAAFRVGIATAGNRDAA